MIITILYVYFFFLIVYDKCPTELKNEFYFSVYYASMPRTIAWW